jgi:hypothetical protein
LIEIPNGNGNDNDVLGVDDDGSDGNLSFRTADDVTEEIEDQEGNQRQISHRGSENFEQRLGRLLHPTQPVIIQVNNFHNHGDVNNGHVHNGPSTTEFASLRDIVNVHEDRIGENDNQISEVSQQVKTMSLVKQPRPFQEIQATTTRRESKIRLSAWTWVAQSILRLPWWQCGCYCCVFGTVVTAITVFDPPIVEWLYRRHFSINPTKQL